jgi:hypothetical protein
LSSTNRLLQPNALIQPEFGCILRIGPRKRPSVQE